MRNFLQIFAAGCLLTLFFVATPAQPARLTSLAQLLDEQAIDLAERIYEDYRSRSFSNRSDVEALYLAQQFSASARVFRRMVSDRRREPELKDGAAILASLLTRADSDFARRNRWNDVRRTVDDIQRTLDGRGSGGGLHEGEGEATSGRLHWRGTVDDNVQLVIRSGYVDVRTIGGTEYNDAVYNFTSPLPRRRNTVRVNKLNGRGTVRVLQQPSRENDFTAVIEIKDSSRGARMYEIEVLW
ncbi:MAG TPA: hypothetical protein VFZ40_18595 [Pyrinomonadaceae bacterium]